MLLVRGVASSTAPVTATVAAAAGESASAAASKTSSTTAAEASSSTTAAHAWDIGALGGDLDVASLEDALVQDEGLGYQARLGKLDIGVAIEGEKDAVVSL